eukprot:g1272.t1
MKQSSLAFSLFGLLVLCNAITLAHYWWNVGKAGIALRRKPRKTLTNKKKYSPLTSSTKHSSLDASPGPLPSISADMTETVTLAEQVPTIPINKHSKLSLDTSSLNPLPHSFNLTDTQSRLFTERVTPETDSTCHLPHIPIVIHSPSVSWIPCTESNPIFSELVNGGKEIRVNCTKTLLVSTTNGQWRFRDPDSNLRLYYRDMYKHKKRIKYIEIPKLKWEEKNSREFIPFNTQVVRLKCGQTYNFYTQFLPDPEKTMPTKRMKEKLNIVHVMTDAFARASFFRQSQGWPKVASLLRKIHHNTESRYQSFVFNRYVSQSMNTIENLVPMYSGVPHHAFTLIEDHGLAPTLVKKNADQDITMLWEHANRNGYQFLMGDEMTNAPQRIMIDSPYIQFFTSHNHDVYNMVKQGSAKKDGERRRQQCYGAEHAVEHEIRETLQFLNQTLGVPKFTFLTMKQAHSRWPDANQDDQYALPFIKKLLNLKEDLALFIASDHGYGYSDHWGKFPKKYPGSEYERLLPFMSIIMPNIFLKKIGRSYLFLNQQRLVSVYDINLTFESLMHTPEELRKAGFLRSRPIPGKPGGIALNLLTEEVPKNRTCRQAGIVPSACVCTGWTAVSKAEYHKPGNSFALVVGKAIAFINSNRATVNSSCLKLSLSTSTIIQAFKKNKPDIGFPHERKAQSSRVLRVKYSSVANTEWRVVASVEENSKKITLHEIIPLHRFYPRKRCWDGVSNLRYCACKL